MEIKLVVVGGVHAGKEIPVRRAKFVIGRGKECQLRPGCNLVSRRHCAIVHDDGRLLIEDLGSTNGTFLNGEKVSAPCELNQGDRLGVGTMEFEVRLFERVDAEEADEKKDAAAAEKTVTGHSRQKADKKEKAAREEPEAVTQPAAAEKKVTREKSAADAEEPVREKKDAHDKKASLEKKAAHEKKVEPTASEHKESGNGEADDADRFIVKATSTDRHVARKEPKAAEDDLDITNWLDEEFNTDFSSAGNGDLAPDSTLPDTATMPSSVDMKAKDDNEDEDEDEDEEEEEEEEEEDEDALKDKKKESRNRATNGSGPSAEPQPTPAPAAKKTDNSRTAATDVLDRMYRFIK